MTARVISLLSVLVAGAALAAPAPEADALRDAAPPRIEIVPERAPAAEPPRRSGNPLWSIPLRNLTATRERPIFSPSRRPPAPAVAAAPAAAPVAPVPAAGPDPLTLVLIGTISGDADSLAILLDAATNQVIRLRTGEAHGGWQLTAVQGREVTLRRDQRTETLRLPKPGDAPAAPMPAGGAPTTNAEPM